MGSSKPSREVHVLDVPDVGSFDADFVYNYHVPEEGTRAEAGVSDRLLTKPGEALGALLVDNVASSRVPRFVRLSWSPVHYRDGIYGGSPYEQDAPPRSGYLRENISKVLSEEHFADERYTAVEVTDQAIDRKIYGYVSSSALVLNSRREEAHTQRGLALQTDALTQDQVDFQFLSNHLVRPSEDNTFFFERDAQRIRDSLAERLKMFHVSLRVSNSVFHTLVKRAASFQGTTFSGDYVPLYEVSKRAQGRAATRSLRDLRADDYRTIVPDHVSLDRLETVNAGLATRTRMIGYIVDRAEISPDGTVVPIEPIVVEDPKVGSTVDIRVRYYGKYRYDVRSVAEITVPAVVEQTGELAVAKFLVASRPSRSIVVDCVELVPPPPPADVSFCWDREADRLRISWAFPPNPQRDIKRFQVFRRRTVREPFQLVRQFDFDDSAVPAPYHERPDPRLVRVDLDPRLSWLDDEFGKDADFIYALGSVDAHGMVSNYGPQTRVTFDRYRNRVRLRRLSAGGAPRPYPNVFLDADVFRDSVVESRKFNMELAFVPEHLRVVDSSGADLGVLGTDRDGVSYKILAMNTDLSVSSLVEVVVEDRRVGPAPPVRSISVPDYGDRLAKTTR